MKYSEFEKNVVKLFSNEHITLGRLGNQERWYKSWNNLEEYDGDSLYAKVNGEPEFRLIDGYNIDDVGVFHIYEFKETEVNGKKGFIIPYLKRRQISGKPDKSNDDIDIKLIISDYDTIKVEKLHHIVDVDRNQMPVNPSISYNKNNLQLCIRLYRNASQYADQPMFFNHNLEKFQVNLLDIEDNATAFKNYVNGIAERLGYDHCYDPIFPEGRNDVAAVRFLSESGCSGFDTLYLVWKDDKIHHEVIAKSDQYMFIDKIFEEDSKIKVDYRISIYEKKIDSLN